MLLERCPHFRGCYVQASMEVGPEDVSLLERCPHFRGVIETWGDLFLVYLMWSKCSNRNLGSTSVTTASFSTLPCGLYNPEDTRIRY